MSADPSEVARITEVLRTAMLTEEQITRFIEESGIVSLKDFLHVERDDITDVLTGIAISKFRARAAASMIMKAADAVAGAGADDEETAAASPPPVPGAAANRITRREYDEQTRLRGCAKLRAFFAAKASETAAEPTESAAAEAEPAVDGSDGWAAANHRQVPLKKHDGEWVTYSYDYYSHYECCWCTDKGSAYCCTPTSPTQNYIKGGSSYNGSGDQTSESSYKSGTKEYFCG